MHKYIPVLSIYESLSESPFNHPQSSTRLVVSTRIPYTEFIAVTAYQVSAESEIRPDNFFVALAPALARVHCVQTYLSPIKIVTPVLITSILQNDVVIKLKIEYNPFAKGFREGSQSDRKRVSLSRDDSTPEDGCSQVSSPQTKKSRVSASPPTASPPTASPPTAFHFPPSMFPPSPAINPMFFNPLIYQMLSPNLPPFPFGFPFYSPMSFPRPPMTNLEMENKEVEEEEGEPELKNV